MKYFLLAGMLFSLQVGSAEAIVDPTPDLLGLYFDEAADLFCINGVAPYALVAMYAIYTNPSFEEIVGFEFGMDSTGNMIILGTLIPGAPFWDPIEYVRYAVGFTEPRQLEQANILVSFNLLNIDPAMSPITFSLREADIPSGPWDVPGVILPGGEFMPVAILNGLGNVSAAINMECALDTQPTSLESLKALFR